MKCIPTTEALRLGLIACGLLAVAACAADDSPPPADGPVAGSTPQSAGPQRIVLVGPRFDVWTVRENGEDSERFVGEGVSDGPATFASIRGQQAETARYTWPAWSPDGERAALSRVPGLGEGDVAGLVMLDADGSGPRQVHKTFRGSVPLVAQGAPHYALWAPTSRALSFVAPREPGRGLGLFSVDSEGGGLYEISANAPLYHVWSPDGTLMLVHRRGQLLLHDTRDRSTRDLGADSLRYRVPAFSPDGERIAYVVEENGAGKLVTSKLDGSDRVALMDVPGEAAFAWSPAGGRIAVATRQPPEPFYDGLYVVEEDGAGPSDLLLRGAMAAFYWSPDGSRLAHVALAQDSLAWQIVDPATRETRLLTGFTPTPDFLTHLQFFDQFAPSHLVWSADSTELVFAGAIEGGEEHRVWVLDAAGNEDPRPLAEGRLAFWIPSPGE